MVYHGHVRNGKIELDDNATLPEGVKVNVSVVPGDASEHESRERSLQDRLKSFIGSAKGLPDDASTNVDHYLYGHPKR